eukprot:4936589-Prymnesium_polylepis.1
MRPGCWHVLTDASLTPHTPPSVESRAPAALSSQPSAARRRHAHPCATTSLVLHADPLTA